MGIYIWDNSIGDIKWDDIKWDTRRLDYGLF